MNVHKFAYTVPMTLEAFADMKSIHDPWYGRRVASETRTPPTEADWAEYREGIALLEKLRANRFYSEGGPDGDSTIDPPEDTITYVYAETQDEWLDRVRHLMDYPDGERT